jgi:hypothetical protein
VLAGQIGYNAEGKVIGEMVNNEAVDKSIDGITETSYTIPKGYHNGEGAVRLTDDIANEVDSQTDIISQIKSALQGKAVGEKQEQIKELNVTENGSYIIEPDEGYTLSEVNINVDVPDPNTLPDWDEDSPIIASGTGVSSNQEWELTEKGTLRWKIVVDLANNIAGQNSSSLNSILQLDNGVYAKNLTKVR